MSATRSTKEVNLMKKIKNTAVVFIISVSIGLMALLAVMMAEKGTYWSYFFWKDEADTGMDFYNSLAESVRGKAFLRITTAS